MVFVRRLSSTGWRRVHGRAVQGQRNEPLFQGEQAASALFFRVNEIHDVMLVKFHRFFAQVEHSGDLLDRSPFAE